MRDRLAPMIAKLEEENTQLKRNIIEVDEAVKICCDERKERTSNTDYVNSFGQCEYLASLLKANGFKVYKQKYGEL